MVNLVYSHSQTCNVSLLKTTLLIYLFRVWGNLFVYTYRSNDIAENESQIFSFFANEMNTGHGHTNLIVVRTG